MKVKSTIWLLPVLSALVFALGVMVVFAFSTRTSQALDAVGQTHYPYLSASQQLGSRFDALVVSLQGAASDGDKKHLEATGVQAEQIRALLKATQAIPARAAAAQRLHAEFDAYYGSAVQAIGIVIGSQQGDEAAALSKMQAAQKLFAASVQQAHAEAQEGFDTALAGAKKSTGATLVAILASAGLVLVGLGIGSRWVVRQVWRQLGGEPEYARDAVLRVAQGDLSHDIAVQPGADGSLLHAVRDMVQQLRSLVGDVQNGAQSISHATTEIASGNADLSNRTEQQASALQQTAASMQQMTDSVQLNAGNAQQANQFAVSATQVADRGGVVVTQVVTTMTEISASSRKISDIIGVIDGIAFQTNILALNAARTCRRAGPRLRGGRERGAVAGPAQRAGGARDQDLDQCVGREGRQRHAAGRRGRQDHDRDRPAGAPRDRPDRRDQCVDHRADRRHRAGQPGGDVAGPGHAAERCAGRAERRCGREPGATGR
ncbi:hypothetical protein ASC88_24270 [Rhizobacter sp. Root29]|nr:hypothetical protein ASC88_24270 [Rhizobacter sp. Root29]